MEFTNLDLPAGTQFVYRLWAGDGTCLYVGQHTGIHPAARLAQHAKEKDWWPEVARIDYAVVDGDLDEAELEQIRTLNPRHNVARASNSKRNWGDYKPVTVRIHKDDWPAFGDLTRSEGMDPLTALRVYIRQCVNAQRVITEAAKHEIWTNQLAKHLDKAEAVANLLREVKRAAA